MKNVRLDNDSNHRNFTICSTNECARKNLAKLLESRRFLVRCRRTCIFFFREAILFKILYFLNSYVIFCLNLFNRLKYIFSELCIGFFLGIYF